jgi:hypothetical protein
MQIIFLGPNTTNEQKTPLPARWFLQIRAMIEAQNKICVNPRLSVVRFFAFFVLFCGYSLTSSYED